MEKKSGNIIFHPLFQQGKQKKYFGTINNLEIFCYLESLDCHKLGSEGQILFHNILNSKSGSFTLRPLKTRSNQRSKNFPKIVFDKLNSMYDANLLLTWLHIVELPYIAILVTKHSPNHSKDKMETEIINKSGEGKTKFLFNNTSHNISTLFDSKLHQHPNLYYHRLDLLPPTNGLCRHFRQPATLGSGTIYLYPSSFKEWSDDIEKSFTMEDIKEITEYLEGNQWNISGRKEIIKSGVKKDIGLVTQITNLWRNSSYTSAFNNYIVRRFIATMNGFNSAGVYYAYPGTPIPSSSYDWDPRRQEWFLDAMEFPDRVVMSSPRLDAGGAGYVLTLSHSIKKDNKGYGFRHFAFTSQLKGSTPFQFFPNVGAVMGMDMSLGIVSDWLIQLMPYCKETNIRCFLFDNHGYLIVHPNMLKPVSSINVEKEKSSTGRSRENSLRNHLTHVEPLIANDLILNHGPNFVKKKVCKQLSDMSLQRYYEFNTNHIFPVITNTENSEHCSQYKISVLQGTNLFLGVVNVTCITEPKTFCPCNIRGRKCILCNYETTPSFSPNSSNFDEDLLKTCECPCECDIKVRPRDMSLCTSYGSFTQLSHNITTTLGDRKETPLNNHLSYLQNIEHCPIQSVAPPKPSFVDYKRLASAIEHLPQVTGSKHYVSLPKCFDTDCKEKLSKKTCFGVIGCSWCEFEYDTKFSSENKKFKNISKPFCTVQSLCFSGVLNGYNPYKMYTDTTISAHLAKLNQNIGLYEGFDTGSGLFRTSTGTSVGPVAAAILGVFLVIAGSVFCYHTNVRKMCSGNDGTWSADTILSRTRSRVTIDRGDANLFTTEDDDNGDDGEELKEMYDSSNHDVVDSNKPKATVVISPYRMNPSYRRPNNNGTDSDQGYSTFECSTVTPLERGAEGGSIYLNHDSSFAGISHIEMDGLEPENRLQEGRNVLDFSANSILPYTSSESARERLRRFGQKRSANGKHSFMKHIPSSMQSVTSGVSSRTSSPVQSGTSWSNNGNMSSGDLNKYIYNTDLRKKVPGLENEGCESSSIAFTTDSKETDTLTKAALETSKCINTKLSFLETSVVDSKVNENRTKDELSNHCGKDFIPNQIVVSATVHRPHSRTQQ